MEVVSCSCSSGAQKMSQARRMLEDWASGARAADCDVVARIALSEIHDLEAALSYTRRNLQDVLDELKKLKGAK